MVLTKQGEENDLILLSLVRSNEEGKIGFLNVAGRVCVALSRAKVGMFIVGNVEELAKRSNIWSDIQNVLESDDSIGASLQLVCPFHPTIRQSISPTDETSQDQHFCYEICGDVFPICDHKCLQLCHFDDRNHVDTRKCQQRCRRFCSEGHPCPKNCDEICSPCLWTDSTKRTLSCGHEITVKCPTVHDSSVCLVSVIKQLSCGHEITTFCSSVFPECNFQCDFILKCGHPCNILCGHHDKDKHNIRCLQKCEKTKLGCRQPESHPNCNKVRILKFL